jgi:membrane protein CcdC involved in cytochrome C biogenesis
MSYKGIPFTVLMVALVASLAYRRVRRTVGRQRITPRRFVLRASLLVLVGGVLFASLLLAVDLSRLGEVFAALAVGIALGFYGLRLTRFEVVDGAVYYVPNPYLGVIISALLIGRIAYTLVFSAISGNSPLGPASFDPSTSGGAGFQQAYDPVSGTLLYLFIGYYVTYYAGLLMRSRQLSKDPGES